MIPIRIPKKKPYLTVLTILVLIVIVVIGLVLTQQRTVEAAALSTSGASVEGYLGVLTLIPPIVTIALAFLTKEVLTSLLAGGFVGMMMLVAADSAAGPIRFLLDALRNYCNTLIGVMSEPENTAIVILCLCIGGLTNLIRSAGGFHAVASFLMRYIKKPWQAQAMGSGLALMLFFDDYANALITGPVMRPITDRSRVSREKLSFLVDSTAAPVAGIALISSWIAVELSAIQSGFDMLGVQESAYTAFLGSIPFCFYNIFCLGFIFWMILLGRDYGPMYRAECRARSGMSVNPESRMAQEESNALPTNRASLLIAVGAILFLLAYAVIGIYSDGFRNAVAQGLLPQDAAFSLETLRQAFGQAETVTVLVEAAILSALLASVAVLLTKTLSFMDTVNAWVDGAIQLLPTALILALAWTLSETTATLGTANYLSAILAGSLPYWVLPSLVFLVCCAISFSAGSYGCMLLIMPMAVPIAYTIAFTNPAVQNPWALFCACVASVLSGSIFGDHCSPVTDTTILSAQGSGCDLMDHVKTQMPYALTVAATATLLGTLPAGLGISPLLCLPVGLVVIGIILFKFGKHPVADPLERQDGGPTE